MSDRSEKTSIFGRLLKRSTEPTPAQSSTSPIIDSVRTPSPQIPSVERVQESDEDTFDDSFSPRNLDEEPEEEPLTSNILEENEVLDTPRLDSKKVDDGRFSWVLYPKDIKNPGKYEDLQKDYTDVLLHIHNEFFDGIQLIVNRSFNKHFNVGHQIHLGQTMDPEEPPASYNFQTTYLKSGSLLTGRINTEGTLLARWHQDITKWLQLRVSSQLSALESQSMLDIEFNLKGADWYAQFKQQEKGLSRFTYSQALSRRWAAGVEGVYLQPRDETVMSATIKGEIGPDYKGIFTARIANVPTLELGYTHNLSSYFKIATSLMFAVAADEDGQPGLMGMYNVGYQYRLAPITTVRGTISSSKVVTLMLEEQISDSLAAIFCGQINYSQNQYKFGLGLQLMFNP
eukprot:TRINITY_DN609_c0_g3_i1.p1 TRINITY_DN609_c0_g3~~TRINITY_DN609_c0_g3_i1.p1  ORF type:complete len:400 (-),score=47.42 TRINITY_DN609_c0_g3_i1:144-1343(-)